MKHFFVFIFVVMIICSLLSADPVIIKGEGKGNTEEEAEEKARIDLAEKLFPSIIQNITETSLTDDTKKVSQSYSNKSSYTIWGILPPGIDNDLVRIDGTGYIATMTIVGDDATISFYRNRMDEQGISAEDLYNQYLSLDSSVSATKRKETLQSVLDCYKSWESYKDIIIRLGGTVTNENILPKTQTVLMYELDSLITEEENELSRKTSTDSINREVTERLKELSEAKEKNQQAIKEASEQAKEQRILKIQHEITEFTSSSSSNTSLSVSATSLSLESYEEYLHEIKAAQKDLADISNMYESMMKDQTLAIDKSYEEEAEAIRNRTYPRAHLDGNGNPTKEAKKLRENEIKQLREQKNEEKAEIIQTINSSMQGEVKKRFSYYTALIETFKEKEFILYSSKGEALITSVYDGADYSWNLTIQIPTPASSIEDVHLTYESVTGTAIPKKKKEKLSFVDSVEYTETVEAYCRIFDDGKYECTVSFTADIDDNGNVFVSFENVRIKLSESKEIYKELNQKSYVENLLFTDSNYTSYNWLIPVKITHFEIDARLGGSIGKLWNDNTKAALDASIEARMFLYDFFVSVSGDLSFWFVSNINNRNNIMLNGLFCGIGYRVLDTATIEIRTSYGKKLGLLLNPTISVAFYKNKNLRFEAYGGCLINCKTGKTAFTAGIEASWRWR